MSRLTQLFLQDRNGLMILVIILCIILVATIIAWGTERYRLRRQIQSLKVEIECADTTIKRLLRQTDWLRRAKGVPNPTIDFVKETTCHQEVDHHV